MRKYLLIICICCYVSSLVGQIPVYVKDITDPETKVSDALCSPLHTVTICTANLDSVKLFYVKGMGMTLVGPMELTKKERQQQMEIWDLPSSLDYKLYYLHHWMKYLHLA